MSWKTSSGIAIAIHPFVASGKNQISILTGDYLIIYHETKDWYHGQNLLTENDGIFPKSFVSFVPMKKFNSIDVKNFMMQGADLLHTEAQLTLNFALHFIDREQDHKKVCAATKCIEDLVDQLKNIQKNDDSVYDTHKNIARSIDGLRNLLGINKTYRTKYDEFSTFTAWGQEQFSSSIIATNKEIADPDYVVLHFHVELDGLKKDSKELFFTFCLYQSVRLPWISEPVSVKLGPERTKCDLMFNYLEKKNLQNEVHLVVYIYDFTQQNNSSSKQPSVNRSIIGIGFVRLPSLKADVAFRKGPTTLRIEPKMSLSNIFMFGGHEYFISGNDSSCNESLRPAFSPNLKLTFTPYFGLLDNFIDIQAVAYPIISNSLFLPTVIPAKKVVSKLHVCLSGIKEYIMRKREVITVRLFDTSDNTFKNVIKNSYTGKKSNHYNSVSFSCIKEKEVHLAESFCFDLSSFSQEKLKDLNILFELKAAGDSTGTAYALVPIADENGFIEQNVKQTAELCLYHIKNIQKVTAADFQSKGKTAAILKYDTVLSSTLLSANKQLMKLVYYKQFENELESLLSSFKEIPMYEWNKFFKILSYNLIKIINSNSDCEDEAFKVLLYIFSEILTRGRKDYINEIGELIQEHFTPESHQDEDDFDDIKGLYDKLIPEIAESIKIKDTQNFRNILKCASYFFDMSMKSILIYNTDAEINLEPVKNKLKIFFKELNDIISKVPEESDALNSGTVFTDQQLILQHFPAMITALIQCLDPRFLGKTVVSFIRSIRYVKDDKKQIPLDKSRMKVLYILSGTKCWTNPESRKLLQDIYKTELEKAADLPLCRKFVAPTIASLFLSSRDDFALQFIDLLYKFYQKSIYTIENANGNASKKVAEIDADNIAKVLMLIAYKFPDKIPYDLLVELMKSDHLSPHVRLFMYANFAFSSLDKFKEMLGGNKISNQKKNETITLFFTLTVLASEKSSIQLENAMNMLIYPRSFDYSTCRALYEALPKEAKVNPDLIEPLFHCYILSNKSDELFMLFYDLIEADIDVNEKPKTILKPTLDAIYKLSKMKEFDQLISMFQLQKKCKNQDIKEFYRQFEKITIALRDYRKMISDKSLLSTNADKLSEAIGVLIEACKYTDNLQLMPKCLLRLAELNLTCGNHVEASKAYEMFLDYIPCNHDNLEDIYKIENAKTGVELHTNVMLKIIGLYMGSNYDEYALNIIDKLCSNVVKPYQYIDLMKTILDKETAVYHNIVTQERKYSNFFYVHFNGKKFDDYYDNNRSFIYRKHPSVDLNSFIREISGKFQIDIKNISENESQDPNEDHIQVFQVVPSFEEEIEDSFYQPNTNQMKYLLAFSLYKDVTLFKRECDQGKSSKGKKTSLDNLNQFFYRTNESFPSMKSRIEVDMSQVKKNSLEPVDKAMLVIKRRTANLKVETYSYRKLFENNLITNIDSGVISLFTNTINTVVNNFDNGDTQQYVKTFVEDNNFASSNQEKVDQFKDALKEHMKIIEEALNLNIKIVPKEMKDLNQHTLEQIIKVKKKYKSILS